jgi:HEAT repeat protein
MQDSAELSASIFRSLVGSRLTDKYRAIDRLNESSRDLDLMVLRALIVNALKKQFYCGREFEDGDLSIADTRSWLLNALGRISSEDDQATSLIADHISQKAESSEWVRYWALEGLIVGQNPRTKNIAKEATNQEDPLVRMLGLAYLASTGDRDAQEEIRQNLSNEMIDRSVLRALRVVPLQFTVAKLCEIVENGTHDVDQTYDAIVALGRLPSTSPFALRAVRALSSAIVNMRVTPWKDSMRTGAIAALGNLKVESSGPLLLEELTDDNPAIVRQAARSTVSILGLRTSVNRIVEAAAKGNNPVLTDAFARALRWMDRDAVAEELELSMGSGTVVQQETSRSLLSELGGIVAFEKLRARTAAMKQYGDVLERAEDRVRQLFEQSVHEAQRGFQLATWMDVAVFGIGLLLVIASAANALLKTGEFAVWAGVGGVGTLGVLYGLLISNPRRQVREAVDHLMKIKIIFLAYLRRLHQTDQAYTRLILDSEKITAEQLKSYSEIVGSIMEATTKQLSDANLKIVNPNTKSE